MPHVIPCRKLLVWQPKERVWSPLQLVDQERTLAEIAEEVGPNDAEDDDIHSDEEQIEEHESISTLPLGSPLSSDIPPAPAPPTADHQALSRSCHRPDYLGSHAFS